MSNPIKALIAIGIFTFMCTLDGSIVNIALPTMSHELHVSMAQITWVVTIYLIVISAVILIFGRLADLVGKSRVTKLGWAIFIIGSFFSGLNLGLGLVMLLAARVLQAVGASMMMSTCFGLVAQMFPPETRARALSIDAMFVSIGSIAGPALGGLILQLLSWNYIFWINVPIGILAWIFGSRALPKDERQGKLKDIDLSGGFQMSLLIILSFLVLNFGQVIGWKNPIIWIALILVLLFCITFTRTEKRKEKPLLDFGIFKSRIFSISLLLSLLNFTVSTFSNILLPFYLQDYKGYTPGIAGLVMMSYPVAMLISSPISGFISDKLDKELVTFIGICGILLSQIGYLLVDKNSGMLWLVGVTFVQGAAMGIFQSPNNALIMENVNRKYLAVAGSINSLSRNIAFVLGTSFATIVLFCSMSNQLGYQVMTYLKNQPGVFLKGMHLSFLLSFILALVSFFIAFTRLFRHQTKN